MPIDGYEMRKRFSVHSRQDCLDFLVKFQKENQRCPSQKEIRALSRQDKCPSHSMFQKFGGLVYLIEKAGLKPNKKQVNNKNDLTKGDVRVTLLEWGKKMREEDKILKPFSSEDLPVSAQMICKYYPSVKECFQVLGLVDIKWSKLSKEKWTFK